SVTGYIYLQPNSVAAMTWTQFKSIAGTAAGARGIEADTGQAGSLSITFCSFYLTDDQTLFLAPTNVEFGGSAGSPVNISNDVFYLTNMGTTAQQWAITVSAGVLNPYKVLDRTTLIKPAGADNS